MSETISYCFSNDGKRLVLEGGGYTLKVWDVSEQGGKDVVSILGHSDIVASCVFSADGTRFASAAEDGVVKIWDARVARRGRRSAGAPRAWQDQCPVSGRRTFRGYPRRLERPPQLKLWDAATGGEVNTLAEVYGSHAIIWGHDFRPTGDACWGRPGRASSSGTPRPANSSRPSPKREGVSGWYRPTEG